MNIERDIFILFSNRNHIDYEEKFMNCLHMKFVARRPHTKHRCHHRVHAIQRKRNLSRFEIFLVIAAICYCSKIDLSTLFSLCFSFVLFGCSNSASLKNKSKVNTFTRFNWYWCDLPAHHNTNINTQMHFLRRFVFYHVEYCIALFVTL